MKNSLINNRKLRTILESELREVTSQKTQRTEFIIDKVDFDTYKINDFSELGRDLRAIHGGIRGRSHPTEKPPLILNFKFRHCKFPGHLLFDSDLNIEFNDCTFLGFINNNSNVKSKIKFYQCHFEKKIIADNISFEEIVDFWGSTFHETVIFYKVNFNDVSVFSSVVFKHNVLFTYSTFRGQSIFRHTIFKKGFDLSLSNILDLITFFELKFDHILFEALPYENVGEYESTVTEKGIIPLTNKKETYRIIKHQLIENNNVTYSTVFLTNEMNTYRELLKLNNGKFEDRLILFLNKISNNYKSSWIRSSCFIFLFGIAFYFLLVTLTETGFSYVLNGDMISKNFQNFFEFINPTHSSNFLDYLKPSNGFFYIFDFLSKIFIGYGIYQFIQAFRKYKS